MKSIPKYMIEGFNDYVRHLSDQIRNSLLFEMKVGSGKVPDPMEWASYVTAVVTQLCIDTAHQFCGASEEKRREARRVIAEWIIDGKVGSLHN